MRGDMTVPDWKSAHLPATPSRLQNQPPPQSLPFASRLSQSGFLGALGKSRSVPADEDHMKPLLMVDHWRLPGKLVGESNDFNNTIMAVDSVGDELLLDVRRSGFRGGSRDFLLVNPVDFSTRKIQLPESSGKQMLVATYDFERAGEQRPLARLGDHLFRSSRDGVLRYSLSSGNWELLPLLIPQDACLIAAPPHLLAYNRQGIYLVDMAAGAVKILCSNRRRPIETPLDELPDLFRVEIAALGTEHLLCLVNDKSFQFDTKSFKWAPWPEPLGFGRQFKSFQGGVLVGMGTAPLVFGYDLLSEPGAKSQPLFQFARIGDPGLAAGPLDVMAQKIAQPRWLAKIPQQVHSFGFSPLDVTRRNDQLVFLQWQPDTSPVKGTAATYLATLFVCERGLAEPISLKLQWNPSAGGAPEPYLARSVSVHSTTSHLVAVANNFAGVWAISWKRIDDEIAQTREKLRQKLAQDIAAHPDDRRLLRIRDEKNPY